MHCKSLLILLLVAGCKTAPRSYVQPTQNTPIAENIAADAKIAEMILPYTEGMSMAMDEVIGFCPAFLEKKKPNSALGSMMCDAVLLAAQESIPIQTENSPKLNFSILNYGGIRSTLDSGDITVGEVFQIMPFENKIVILKMDNRYLDTLAKFTNLKGGEPMSLINMSEFYKAKKGKSSYFYLITNDYMANGGDNYGFLLNSVERISTGIKIRDAMITYIEQNNPIPLDYNLRGF